MPEHYRIRSIQPVTGDWFCVYGCEDSRWFIERVVAWALVRKKAEIDHVRAIDSCGHPLETDGYDAYFVLGADVSPIGPTWREVFDSTPPSSCMVREITEAAKGFM